MFVVLFGLVSSVAFAGGESGKCSNCSKAASAACVPSASQVVTRVAPKYPAELKHARIPGFVQLKVAVNGQGQVVGAEVLEANAPEFGTAAVAAVEQWTFTPSKDGSVRYLNLPMRFELAGS